MALSRVIEAGLTMKNHFKTSLGADLKPCNLNSTEGDGDGKTDRKYKAAPTHCISVFFAVSRSFHVSYSCVKYDNVNILVNIAPWPEIQIRHCKNEQETLGLRGHRAHGFGYSDRRSLSLVWHMRISPFGNLQYGGAS